MIVSDWIDGRSRLRVGENESPFLIRVLSELSVRILLACKALAKLLPTLSERAPKIAGAVVCRVPLSSTYSKSLAVRYTVTAFRY